MLISVITPTYNRKNYLKECINSVASSITKPLNFKWEHIVVDDGSTDGTPQIFENSQYQEVIYIRNRVNKGGSSALNEGIKRAKGEWIFVLDDDDVIFQRTLHNFANLITSSNNKFSWFVFDFIRADENLKYLISEDYYGWIFESAEDLLSSISRGVHIIQHNTFFKKDLAISCGLYDEKTYYAKDIDLYIRFILSGHLPYYSSIFSHIHRFHGSNISTTGPKGSPKNKDALKKVTSRYPELLKYS